MRRPLLLLALLGVFASTAQAAGSPSMGLRPVGKWKRGYFVYAARPGTVIHGAVAVNNGGTAAGAVRVYAVDSTTGQTSGAVYLTSGQKPKDVGAWIRVATPSATLKTGQARTIPFTLTVPANAAAGQHVGGIVAETVKQRVSGRSKGKASVQVRLRSLSIVAVQVNVPGTLVAKLAVGGVTAGGRKGFQQLLLHVANTGNVMLKPRGSISVSDTKGHALGTYAFHMDTLLPRTAIDYPVNVKGRGLGAGDYRASVRISYTGLGGGGSGLVASAPAFTISSKQQSQVFGGTTNTTAAPSAQPTAAPPATSGGGGTAPLVYIGIGAGIVILLGAVYALGARRARRPA